MRRAPHKAQIPAAKIAKATASVIGSDGIWEI
ncbi:hypothetical protein MNBD_ALPHA11-1585, partial [hydrothermal vent metagenome]